MQPKLPWFSIYGCIAAEILAVALANEKLH